MTRDRAFKDPLAPDVQAGMARCGCCHVVKPLDAYEHYAHRCGKSYLYKNCRICRERKAAKHVLTRKQRHIKPMTFSDWLADAEPFYKDWVTRAWV
jgi:hypothetical protein